MTKWISLLYIIPALKIAGFLIPPLPTRIGVWLNLWPGRFEWFIRGPRDWVLTPLLLLAFLKEAVPRFLSADFSFIPELFYLPLVFLTIFGRFTGVKHLRRMMVCSIYGRPAFPPKADPPLAEAGGRFPISPREFFTYYYAGFGPFKLRIVNPQHVQSAIPARHREPVPRSGEAGGRNPKSAIKSRLRFWPLIIGAINTHSLIKLVLGAYKWKGPSLCRSVADAVSVLWGARIVELGRMNLKVSNIERLSELTGKFIFVFNHKSFLDFALGPLILAGAHPKDRDSFSLRYMAARDHFLDNVFLYRVLGLGKAMEAIGTIFVDRKRKARQPIEAADEAIRRLINLDIDIALFPQGTRALGQVGPNGERMDAGYYTAGGRERLKKEGGHLKKGAAWIAFKAAAQLSSKLVPVPLHIIPVGLVGTATACPRGSMRIREGTTVEAVIGEPITIVPSSSVEGMVDSIHTKIDNGLKSVLEVHPRLEQRFFTDIRKLIPTEEREHLAIAMKTWRGEDYLVYAILDLIYALKPQEWDQNLRRLAHLLIEDSPRKALARFKEELAEKL